MIFYFREMFLIFAYSCKVWRTYNKYFSSHFSHFYLHFNELFIDFLINFKGKVLHYNKFGDQNVKFLNMQRQSVKHAKC